MRTAALSPTLSEIVTLFYCMVMAVFPLDLSPNYPYFMRIVKFLVVPYPCDCPHNKFLKHGKPPPLFFLKAGKKIMPIEAGIHIFPIVNSTKATA